MLTGEMGGGVKTYFLHWDPTMWKPSLNTNELWREAVPVDFQWARQPDGGSPWGSVFREGLTPIWILATLFFPLTVSYHLEKEGEAQAIQVLLRTACLGDRARCPFTAGSGLSLEKAAPAAPLSHKLFLSTNQLCPGLWIQFISNFRLSGTSLLIKWQFLKMFYYKASFKKMLSTLTQTGMTNVRMTVLGKGCALLF